ncbi:SGNH/GDSL hydrolase family protein [bacterium]|nr:SGNH/GDSL hydrolase family protein [bacterium]
MAHEEENRAIIPYLEKYQIYYLDYSDFDPRKYADKDLFIKWDHHPTEEFNRIMAEQIASDLAIPENKISLEKSMATN